MHLRKALLKPGDQIEKILERQIGMQSANDVEFRNRFAVTGSRRLESFFQGHGVGAGRIFLPAEGAQPASRHAHIRGIQMTVDVEVSRVAVHSLAHMIGQPSDRQNVCRCGKARDHRPDSGVAAP